MLFRGGVVRRAYALGHARMSTSTTKPASGGGVGVGTVLAPVVLGVGGYFGYQQFQNNKSPADVLADLGITSSPSSTPSSSSSSASSASSPSSSSAKSKSKSKSGESPRTLRSALNLAEGVADKEADAAAAREAEQRAKEVSSLSSLLKEAQSVLKAENKAADKRHLASLRAAASASTNKRTVSERSAGVSTTSSVSSSDAKSSASAKKVADSAIASASGAVTEKVVVGKAGPVDPNARLDKMARASAVKAKAIAQAATADEMAELLKEDLESSFEGDLSAMSPTELRERVHRLTAELRDRGKWEALRLNEFLKKNEDLWKNKFLEFAAFQHEALKQEVSDLVKAVEAKAEAANDEWRRKELQRLHTKLQEEAQKQLDALTTETNKKAATQTQSRLEALAALRGRVEGIMAHMNSRLEYEAAAHRVHKIATATLAVVDATQVKRDATEAVEALRVAANGDEMIQVALAALPNSIYRKGVPTRKELTNRFDRVMKEGRAAAMVPESGGLVGQAIGTVTAALFIGSKKDDNSGTGAEVAAVNEVFDAADAAMTRGDLSTTVAELNRLQGYPGAAVKDFVTAATERLTLEQSLRAIRAQAATLTASMY